MKRAKGRSRSGSITLQLRSAADLEARGIIDAKMKKILKNKIMTGDQSLQHALQQYEAGDPLALEALVNSGALIEHHGGGMGGGLVGAKRRDRDARRHSYHRYRRRWRARAGAHNTICPELADANRARADPTSPCQPSPFTGFASSGAGFIAR